MTTSPTLTDKQHDLLNFVEQCWYLNGAIPTKDATVGHGVCSADLYSRCFADETFIAALDSRGISVSNLVSSNGGVSNLVLTELQLAAANTMLDLRDNRSQKKKLADLGVPTQKWEAWLRDPAFQSYLRTRAENLLGDNIHESHLALVDRVRSGDVNAIKYYNEITGRYVSATKNDQVDVNLVLLRVLEVIQKHVTDPTILEAIGSELAALSAVVVGNVAPQPVSARLPRIIEGV